MIQELRIAWLKLRLRFAVRAYWRARDQTHGGAAIAATMSFRVRAAAVRANRLLDALAKLDPDCPKTRFKT